VAGILTYALLAAWQLAGNRLGILPPAPARFDGALLVLAPVALGVACTGLWVQGARLRNLRKANAAADASAQASAQALRTVSHEMRTALNAMVGFSGLLGKSALTPAQVEQVLSIQEGSAHLLAVVSRILEESQLEAGRVALHDAPFQVDALARACLRSVSPAAARKGLGLVFHGPRGAVGRFVGDATRVHQVLLNLLSNAVKFTPRGTVSLTVWAGEAQGGRVPVHLEVRDTGVGIRPEDLGRLFQPFSQVGTPDPQGTGLGLAISRQLCRRMGGDLTVESRPGEGSAFTATVLLRVAPPPGAPAPAASVTLRSVPAPAVPAGRAGDLAILLAEDNAMNRRLALKALEGLGHAAAVAANGAEAVAMAGRQRYDVILMDVHMPVLDGLQATQALRSRGPDKGRPFIIGLTADALPGDRERCLQAGMDAHLAKPMEGEALAVLLDVARRHRAGPPAQGVAFADRRSSAQAAPF
jgi:signal transduction histidine kinase/FixJ family two-component response regulator